ncbi:MAG: H-X9-DG-CTERM domain-containing protein, partial [Fimbriimonadaceae bacterium]
LATAQIMYGADYDDMILAFPYAGRWSSPSYPNPGDFGPNRPFWSDLLMPYVKNRGVFANPANSDPLYAPGGYLFPGQLDAADTDVTRRYRVTVAMNHMINRADRAPLNPGAASFTGIDEPAQITMLGPSQYAWTFSSCQPDSPGSTTMSFYWLISQDGIGWGYELWGRRNELGGFDGGANFSFVDGHAKFSRAVRGNTAPGDELQEPTLFRGYFPQAKTRAAVRTNGTCPGDRGSVAY